MDKGKADIYRKYLWAQYEPIAVSVEDLLRFSDAMDKMSNTAASTSNALEDLRVAAEAAGIALEEK